MPARKACRGKTVRFDGPLPRQRTADVAAIGSVTRALTAGSDPRAELTAAAQLVTGAAFSVLIEPQDDGTLIATAGSAGIELSAVRSDPRAEVSATAEVWRTGARIYIGDVRTDPRSSSRMAAHTGARAVLLQPVLRDGQCTGVLIVGFSRSRQVVPEQALTGDIIARWGGEEFALALPGCDLRAAQRAATRFLQVVPGGQSASIGLTQAAAGDTSRSLIARADRALYVAKDAGRNRVHAVPDAASPSSLLRA